MRLLIPAFVLLAGFAGISSFAFVNPSESGVATAEVVTETAKAVDIDITGLAEAMRDPAPELILDVRTPGEFRRGHVPGAVNLPTDVLPSHLGDLEAHRASTIYVICESGNRSARVTSLLLREGFDAVNVLGGTGAWRRARLPIE